MKNRNITPNHTEFEKVKLKGTYQSSDQLFDTEVVSNTEYGSFESSSKHDARPQFHARINSVHSSSSISKGAMSLESENKNTDLLIPPKKKTQFNLMSKAYKASRLHKPHSNLLSYNSFNVKRDFEHNARETRTFNFRPRNRNLNSIDVNSNPNEIAETRLETVYPESQFLSAKYQSYQSLFKEFLLTYKTSKKSQGI